MEFDLTEATEYDRQLPHDYQRENNQIGVGDKCLLKPVKTIKDEYMEFSDTSNGQDDQTKTCYMNGPLSISCDTWKLERSGKLTSIEEEHYVSIQQPQLQSQYNIIKGKRDEMESVHVSDFEVKPELENGCLSYTGQMDETNALIDQKLTDLKPCYMDQKQMISSSSVKMNLLTHSDECDKPYEQIYPKTIQASSVFHDLNNALKSEVVSNIIRDGGATVDYEVLNKVNSECFVRLERLNPGYIKERTQPRSSAPDLPGGMSVIPTDTGVWSTRFFPKGTKFGPYDQSAVSSDSLTDGIDWTSSVRKSSGDDGHNMEVEQLGSKIFYKIVTDIQPQTELSLRKLKPANKIDDIGKDSEMSCQQLTTSVTTQEKYPDQKPHECKQSEKLFCHLGSLKNHMKSHTKSHKCSECGKLFSNHSMMERHMLTHTKIKQFQCIECGKDFSYKSTLVLHMLTHSGEKAYQCKQCGKFFSRSGNLKKHMRSHTGEKSYKCNECGKLFSAHGDMKRHMLTHTKEKAFQCIECGKEFTYKSTLASHMLKHSGEKPYECKQCGKFFFLSETLKQHLKSHTGVKSHKCSVCGKLWYSISKMNRHMLTHTKEEQFHCIECGKQYTLKASLLRHMLTHSGEKPHECKQCGKFFSRSGALKQHMITHTIEKSHECSECGKLFSNPRNMKRHMVTHTTDKPFQCIECGNKFKQKPDLVRHMFTHSGEKPHGCKQCGKFFSVSGSLKRHMQSHTGEKSHKCSECGELFSQSSSMKTHMLTHTKEKAFQCIECGKQFALKYSVLRHMLTHSGEKPHECSNVKSSPLYLETSNNT